MAEKKKRASVIGEKTVVEPELEVLLEETAQESTLSKKNKVQYSLGLICTLGIIAASVAIFVLYLSSISSPQKSVVNTIPTPTPTPVHVFTPNTITVEVYNGSGVAGAAAKAAVKLKTKGYQIAATGNEKKIPASTVLTSSRMSPDDTKTFLADLGELFGMTTVSGELKGSTATARLILGAK